MFRLHMQRASSQMTIGRIGSLSTIYFTLTTATSEAIGKDDARLTISKIAFVSCEEFGKDEVK